MIDITKIESIQIKFIHEWKTWAVCYLNASGDYAWDASSFTEIEPDFFYLQRDAIAYARSEASNADSPLFDVPITIERKDAYINQGV